MLTRLWLLVPACGLLAVGAAIYERIPAAVAPPRTLILCREPLPLDALFWTVALFIVAATAACIAGIVRAVTEPSPSGMRPILHLAVALVLLVGADGLDELGRAIATSTASHYANANTDTCTYPIPVYDVTPGWFF
jgi:uncharacterized oligopeptide transporter (OPT) family protein